MTHYSKKWELGYASNDESGNPLYYYIVSEDKSHGNQHLASFDKNPYLGIDLNMAKSNAKLASFAPEMLEALKTIIPEIEKGFISPKTMDMCKNVIKKATE